MSCSTTIHDARPTRQRVVSKNYQIFATYREERRPFRNVACWIRHLATHTLGDEAAKTCSTALYTGGIGR